MFIKLMSNKEKQIMNLKKYFNKNYTQQEQIDNIAKKYSGKKIALYGAGLYAKALLENHDFSALSIVGISDKRFADSDEIECFGFKTIVPSELNNIDVDLIVLLVQDSKIIKKFLTKEVLDKNKNKKIKIIAISVKQSSKSWWNKHKNATQKFYILGVVSTLGGSFKEYLLKNNMKEKIELLKAGLDKSSIKVVDNVLTKILHLPDSEYGKVYFAKNRDMEEKFGTEEGKKLRLFFFKNLEMYKNKYKLVRPKYNMEVFFYDHGLFFANQKIREYIKNKDFIDAGAYFGDSALVFMKYSPKKVYSFEMSAKNSIDYLKTMQLNNIPEDKYELVQCAVLDSRKTIHIDDSGRIGTNLFQQGNQKVECIDIDSFAKEKNLKIGFIKADVEGSDLEALLGMKETIQRDRPVISISNYHNPEQFFEMKPLLDEMTKDLNYEITIEDQKPHGRYLLDTVIFAYPAELQ